MSAEMGGLHWAHTPDNRRYDLKKLVNSHHEQTHQLCCICFDYILVEDLWVDEDGTKWDICQKCKDRVRPL